MNKGDRITEEIVTKHLKLDLYKSIFKSHPTSAVFNLYIKKKNGKRIWIDKNVQYWELHELDDDPEVKEWLKPIPCER